MESYILASDTYLTFHSFTLGVFNPKGFLLLGSLSKNIFWYRQISDILSYLVSILGGYAWGDFVMSQGILSKGDFVLQKMHNA